MPQDERLLVVPLRSNAHTLLNGAPVAAMRRRLKYASLLFDDILLESGVLRVWAGPHGSSSMVGPPSAENADRFQTAHERRAAVDGGFQVAMAEESTGAPARVVVAHTSRGRS